MMKTESNLWKGLAAGVAGGLAASVVMNQFQAILGRLMEGTERSHGAQSLQKGSPNHGAGRELKQRGSDEEQDDAAMRLGPGVALSLWSDDRNGPASGTARVMSVERYIFRRLDV